MSDAHFDTNIVIDWLMRRDLAYAELSRYERPRLSRIAWAEVLAGEASEAQDQVVTVLRGFEIVEVTERIAALAIDIRRRSRMKLLDALIYATARAEGAVLITRDTKAFSNATPGVRIPYTL